MVSGSEQPQPMAREQPVARDATNIFEDPLFKRATEIFGSRPGETPLD
jgi:hypothetical protein